MYSPINLHSIDFPITQYLTENHLQPPLIVGGVGGSGTRLVVQLLKNLGVSMGLHLNVSEDALAFVPLYERYINQYLVGLSVNYQHLADELLAAMINHRRNSLDAHHWGWKNPRSIYLLPILDSLIPGLRFVHVVRDGVAMSTSDNQAQLEKHGSYVLQDDMQTLPKKERSLLLWTIVNNAAADYGKTMGDRYFLVRYEDACENPSKAFSAIGASLGLKLPNVWDVPLRPPRMRQDSINQDFSPMVIEQATTALKRFGYSC
ncbi:MAG: sulfotransferase [Methylobacter sp.]|nr:sulfotransferase [Methylobacter sp.]